MGLILPQKVKIKAHNRTSKYYESLGYDVPKRIGYWGNPVFDFGSEFEVDISDLSPHATYPILCNCDDCGKDLGWTMSEYTSYNHDGKCYCNKCANKRFCSGENSTLWNPDLTNEDRESNRSTPEYNLFVRNVMTRDEGRCQICGEPADVVHHMDGYHWCKERRTDVTNGVALCNFHHESFHGKYGKGDNTEEQFIEFSEGIKLNLSDFQDVSPCRKVYVAETDTIYTSAEECASILDIGIFNVYKACANEKHHYSKGYHMFYYDDYIRADKKNIEECLQRSINIHDDKRIILLNTKEIFINLSNACEKYNIKLSTLSAHLLKNTQLGMFLNGVRMKFMYYTDYSKLTDEEIQKILYPKTDPWLICINTLATFNSTEEASEYAGVNCATILRNVNHPDESSHAGYLGNIPLVFMKYREYINCSKEVIEQLLEASNPFIICLTLGKEFYKYREGSEYVGLKDIRGIANCCNGRSKSAGKTSDGTPIKWMYYKNYINLTPQEKLNLINEHLKTLEPGSFLMEQYRPLHVELSA